MEFCIHENFKQNASDVQDMETQASPSLINMKQSDLKIVIDSTIDETSQSSLFSTIRNPIEYINDMIEKIKSLSKKKKVTGNIWEYNTCHSCRGLLENKLLVRCVEEECSRYFCLRCMNKKYSVSCEEIYDIIQIGKWTCFSCEGICNCKICKDRFLEHDMYQLVAFEKSKRKSPKIATNIKPLGGFTNLEREDSIKSIKSIKEPKVQRQDSKSSYLEARNIEQQQLTPKETGKMNFMISRSKIRSKILAKKQIHQRQHFLEDSSDEEAEKPETAAEVEKSTEASQRGSKKVSRGGKRKSNEECHMCGKVDSDISMAICSVDKCKKGFCEPCIFEHFQQDFTFKNYNPECWICYRCAGLCKCHKCSRKRMTGFKIINDDFLNQVDFKRGQGKPIAKRRPKYYDPLTDDEYEIHFHDQGDDESDDAKQPSDSENSKPIREELVKRMLNKRKRLNKGSLLLSKEDIVPSQIISEINIDSACLTLYAAENEEELLTAGGIDGMK